MSSETIQLEQKEHSPEIVTTLSTGTKVEEVKIPAVDIEGVGGN